MSRPTHVLNGGPAGATFPGWFLQVQQNEGYDCVIEPTQLSIAQVKVITSEIDQLMDGTSRSLWRITHAAERCDNAMHDELKRQLAAVARRWAAQDQAQLLRR